MAKGAPGGRPLKGNGPAGGKPPFGTKGPGGPPPRQRRDHDDERPAFGERGDARRDDRRPRIDGDERPAFRGDRGAPARDDDRRPPFGSRRDDRGPRDGDDRPRRPWDRDGDGRPPRVPGSPAGRVERPGGFERPGGSERPGGFDRRGGFGQRDDDRRPPRRDQDDDDRPVRRATTERAGPPRSGPPRSGPPRGGPPRSGFGGSGTGRPPAARGAPGRPPFDRGDGDERGPTRRAAPPGDLLYGRNAVMEALRAGRGIRRVMVATGAHGEIITEIVDTARAKKISVLSVDRRRLDDLAFNHQGVVAEAAPYEYAAFEDLVAGLAASATPPLVLVLDVLQDPQNLGSLLRTAAAAGVHGVVIPENRAVGVTPAVVKASAGAIEKLTIAQVVNLSRAIDELKEAGLWAVGLDAGATSRYDAADLNRPIALVVGGEGKGLRPLVRQHCDIVVSLPMPGGTESLNAAVAGSIVLYEILRQRINAAAALPVNPAAGASRAPAPAPSTAPEAAPAADVTPAIGISSATDVTSTTAMVPVALAAAGIEDAPAAPEAAPEGAPAD